MDSIIDIVQRGLEQLQRNLAGHAVVGIGLAATMLFLVVGITIPIVLVPIAGGLLPDHLQLPVVLAALGLGAVGLFVVLLPIVVIQAGYLRSCIREVDGNGLVTPAGVFADAKEIAGRALLTNLIVQTLTTVGMLFCYLPGFAVAFALWNALPLVVAGGRSPVDAVKESAQAVMADPLTHAGRMLGFVVVVMIVAWIPLIGTLAATPIATVYLARAFRKAFPDLEKLPALVPAG